MGRRSQIIQAAMAVFAREGFHRARVEDIAAEAGVGKGTVYQYFSSKEELFREMFKASLGLYSDTLKGELARGKGAGEKLARVAEVSLDLMARGREVAKVMLENPGSISEDLKRWLFGTRQELIALVRGVMEEGIAAGEFRRVNPELAARVFLGANHVVAAGLLFGEREALPAGEMSAIATALMDLFLHGVSTRSDGPAGHDGSPPG